MSLFDDPLPRDHGARIAFLRGQAPALPHLDLYLAGEHEQVWRDLVALGPAVRTEAHAADALAVAYETMERVDANVRTLAERLDRLGYRFVEYQRGLFSGFFKGKPVLHLPHVPPEPGTARSIARLERIAGGPIPLSLRAFYDVVGAVNFTGEHPQLAPSGGDVVADALFVYGVQDGIECLEGGFDEEEEDKRIVLAPDAFHKSDISGGESYGIAVPAPVADARLEEEPHEGTFVEYLRVAMAWGGFPGWEEAGTPPEALAQLRRDLIAF